MKPQLMVPLSQSRPWRHPTDSLPPPSLQPWLTDRDSMTLRLRRHHGHITLQLLGCHRIDLTPDEQVLVAATEATAGWCREVIIHGEQGPALLGVTLFSEVTARATGLYQQGCQPLGERIFSHEPARREHLQLAEFEIRANPWCAAASVWGRRSQLYLGSWPLLVHEFFLPSGSYDKELT